MHSTGTKTYYSSPFLKLLLIAGQADYAANKIFNIKSGAEKIETSPCLRRLLVQCPSGGGEAVIRHRTRTDSSSHFFLKLLLIAGQADYAVPYKIFNIKSAPRAGGAGHATCPLLLCHFLKYARIGFLVLFLFHEWCSSFDICWRWSSSSIFFFCFVNMYRRLRLFHGWHRCSRSRSQQSLS